MTQLLQTKSSISPTEREECIEAIRLAAVELSDLLNHIPNTTSGDITAETEDDPVLNCLQGVHVLLIDSSPTRRTALESKLSSHKMAVTAVSTQDAFAELKRSQNTDPYQIIIVSEKTFDHH